MEGMTTPPTQKMEWRRAWKAVRELIADPQRTDLAFEVIDALSGTSFDRSFERFRTHPDGRRLLAERPSLLATLSNREALSAMPLGSFGRAYVEFMQSGSLTAEGLVEAQAVMMTRTIEQPIDPDRRFFSDRVRDMHDLWHVLTGYGMDEAGEAANLAFNLGQIPNLGIAMILLAVIAIGPKDLSFSWPRYLYRARQRGQRAALLTVVRYEELLARPLDEVRQLLHIQPAHEAHPHGILVGNRVMSSNSWILSWSSE